MRVTKHEHACLVVEKGGQKLVIDPGNFTVTLGGIDDVVGIVITHEHADHWTPQQLERLLETNADARIFAPAGVVTAASDFDVTEVADGDTIEVGEFTLAFFGRDHEVIHRSIPIVNNVGVLVDGTLYYPGDSYTIPPVPVHTLAAPSAAPWLRISDAIDFVAAVAPKHVFPTHQIVLSRIGQDMMYARLKATTEAGGGEFHPLEPGESLDI